MNVSIIIPAQASEESQLAATLQGIVAQQYDAGRIEVFVVHYGKGESLDPTAVSSIPELHFLTIRHQSPYAARNLAASRATGEIFLFTEPGSVPAPNWVAAHVARLKDETVTVSVGRVIPARMTRLTTMFLAYEDVRDEWVFSCPRWKHYFGRPKNMAVARRRFETHGPFAEVIRGADSKLVQLVAREISCSEIGLTPEAIVRQAAIRNLGGLFVDRYRHARALRIYGSSHSAPIPFDQRVQLFRSTLAQRGYGPIEAATLVMLLGAGIQAFRLGGLSGAVAKRRNNVQS